MLYLASSKASNGSPVAAVVIITFVVVIYFIPTIIAWVRHVPNAMSVTVVNFFTGWFFGIGWIVALAMACRSGHLRNTVTGERN